MERKIGEIFPYKGEWYQCVEGGTCSECSFRHIDCSISNIGDCTDKRTDGVRVIFKKLEKVGEPMMIHDKFVQKIKNPNALGCLNCHFYHNATCELTLEEAEFYDCGEGTIYIEIKQNQEDMEEKKPNLKEFDLEAAKAGKPVCTRDGRKARIICFDRKIKYYPILALVTERDGNENAYEYSMFGEKDIDNSLLDADLMMLPEKHEGWINICKNADEEYYTKGVFNSEKYARNNEANYPGSIVATVKIEWEE